MNRAIVALLSALVVLVAATGAGVWRADHRAHEDAERQACIQKAEATGIFVLLGGDSDKRVDAARTLALQIDAC